MLDRLRELISDSMTYGFSSVLRQAIGFFLLPLYTRYLTPEDYGLLALLGIITMLFLPLSNLGVSNAIFRYYNLEKDEQQRIVVLSTGFWSLVLTSVLGLGLCSMLAEPISILLLKLPIYRDLVILTLIGATFDSITQVPQAILRADRRVKLAASLNVFGLLISILLTIGFVVPLKMGVLGIMYANLFSSIISFAAILYFVIKSLQFSFDLHTWQAMISYGLPFLPHRVMSMGMTQFGIYMISQMIGAQQVGLYSIAMRIIMPLQMVVNSVQQAWVPFKFQIFAEDDQAPQTFRSITTYYVALTTYLWLGVSIWGPELVRLMTTAEFHDVTTLVPFVALVPVAQGWYFMFGTGIELSNNTKPLPVVSFLGLVAVVIGALILVPVAGAYGAALATVIGWCVMTGSIYVVSQRRVIILYDWRTMFQFQLCSLFLALISFWAQDQSFILRIAVAVLASCIYPLVLYIVLSRNDTEQERLNILRIRILTLLRR
jgi:O-antigen/teichoic acid export membrane protein